MRITWNGTPMYGISAGFVVSTMQLTRPAWKMLAHGWSAGHGGGGSPWARGDAGGTGRVGAAEAAGEAGGCGARGGVAAEAFGVGVDAGAPGLTNMPGRGGGGGGGAAGRAVPGAAP